MGVRRLEQAFEGDVIITGEGMPRPLSFYCGILGDKTL